MTPDATLFPQNPHLINPLLLRIQSPPLFPRSEPCSLFDPAFPMPPLEVWFRDALRPPWIPCPAEDPAVFVVGGLFLDSSVPNSITSSISVANPAASAAVRLVAFRRKKFVPGACRRDRADGGKFLSVSLSVKGAQGFVPVSEGFLGANGERGSEEPALEGKKVDEMVVAEVEVEKRKRVRTQGAGAGAMNTTKHLWAGAVAAMVSR